MKHLRSLLAVALFAGAAAPAKAQWDPGAQQSSDQFRVVSGGAFSPYGTYQGQFLAAPGSPVVDVWCVDFLHHATTSYDGVDITRYDSPDFSSTRFGPLYYDSYLKAAYLTRYFSGLSNATDVIDLHYTIWHLFTPLAPLPFTNPGGLAAELNWLGQLNGGAWKDIDKTSWFVVSDQDMSSIYPGLPQVGGHQEFLVHVTPEPSVTLLMGTGLVGLVGLARIRRRKKTDS